MKDNFKVSVEEEDNKVILSITGNGNQWSTVRFPPEKTVLVVSKLNVFINRFTDIYPICQNCGRVFVDPYANYCPACGSYRYAETNKVYAKGAAFRGSDD